MTKVVKKATVLERIMIALNLGEEGKLGKFFKTLVKEEKTEIKKLQANLKSQALQHEIIVEELEAKIEDAEEAVEAAYEAVTPDDVATNAAMKSFASSYWYKVGEAEELLEGLEESLKGTKENYDKRVENINKQIAKRQARINNIG